MFFGYVDDENGMDSIVIGNLALDINYNITNNNYFGQNYEYSSFPVSYNMYITESDSTQLQKSFLSNVSAK